MSDLIERLRMVSGVCDKAADEIERLTKLNSQKNADISDWAEKYAEKCNEAAEFRQQLAECRRKTLLEAAEWFDKDAGCHGMDSVQTVAAVNLRRMAGVE